MATRRIERLNGLLRGEISELISRELKDPRLLRGMLSITGVSVTADLHYAKVFVSVLGTEQDRKDALAALHSASGFIRKALAERVQIRHMPELNFVLDLSMERGERIMKLLHEIRAEDEQTGAAQRESRPELDVSTDPPTAEGKA